MKIAKLSALLLLLIGASSAKAQDACYMVYLACVADCEAPHGGGPPVPGGACIPKCIREEMACNMGGECSPFCPI